MSKKRPTPDAVAAALLAANPGAAPRPLACSGSGQFLFWITPNGERLCIGVAVTVAGITYRQLLDSDDIAERVAELYSPLIAQQLARLLHATAGALSHGDPLPVGIHGEAVPLLHGDHPGQMLERLYRHSAGASILLKKKPPSLAERSSGAENTPATTPATAGAHTPGAPGPAAPTTPGAKA